MAGGLVQCAGPRPEVEVEAAGGSKTPEFELRALRAVAGEDADAGPGAGRGSHRGCRRRPPPGVLEPEPAAAGARAWNGADASEKGRPEATDAAAGTPEGLWTSAGLRSLADTSPPPPPPLPKAACCPPPMLRCSCWRRRASSISLLTSEAEDAGALMLRGSMLSHAMPRKKSVPG